MTKNKLVHLIWVPLSIYLIYTLSKLAWFDSLSSLANDSVHYLVMARHYSPWHIESVAIASTWLIQDFPPFFPWVLAFSGASHNLLFAHILVIGIGLVSLYFYYLLSTRWLDSRIWVVLPVFIFAYSPGFILGLQGILSESLFLVLTLLFLLFYKPTEKISSRHIILAALLLAAVLLTRTIGIALILAVLAQAFFSSISQKCIKYQPVIIVVAALLVYFLLMAIWGPVKESHYLDILIRYLQGNDLYDIGTNTEHFFSITSQLDSLLNSWTSFWIIYWKADGLSTPYFVTTALLFLSLSGLLLRLMKSKYDAWYTLFYLLILLVWPHPGQMMRLLFPVMPLLLIYSGYTVTKLVCLTKYPDRKDVILFIFYLFILVTVLPSHAFIHGRVNIASEKQMIPVYEIFRRADLEIANNDLELQNQILEDFKTIRSFIPRDEKVMYFVPSYQAILNDIQSVKIPSPVYRQEYLRIARESNAKYMFLTRLHPRKTRLGYNGFQGVEGLNVWAQQLWCSHLRGGEITSCLYKIR